MFKFIVATIFLILSQVHSTHADELDYMSAGQVCSGFPAPKSSVCMAVIGDSRIANKRGIKYALLYLATELSPAGQRNQQRLKCRKNQNKKITNACRFVFNDVMRPSYQEPARSQAFLIDLCDGREQHRVRPFAVSRGRNTDDLMRRGTADAFRDVNGHGTTVLGAFVTQEAAPVQFTPHGGRTRPAGYPPPECVGMTNPQCYNRILGSGKARKLSLMGLHSTNNRTADGKPFHTCVFTQSSGCPAVAHTTYNLAIMHDLARGGPALFLNYGPDQFHPYSSINNCEVPGHANRPGEYLTPTPLYNDGYNTRPVRENQRNTRPVREQEGRQPIVDCNNPVYWIRCLWERTAQ